MEFQQYDGPKLYYAEQDIEGNHFFIEADEFLFQKGIRSINDFFKINNTPFLFKKNNAIGTDIFSAVFYVTSRMEEYTQTTKDKHGRYLPENSILSKMEVLHLPIVNVWLAYLKSEILKKFPNLVFEKKQFSFQPSYDIDMAWAYKNKGLLRSTSAKILDLFKGDKAIAAERKAVLKNEKKDPFDNFDFFDNNNRNARAIYFLLMGDHGTYDKNTHHQNKEFQALIQNLANKYTIGVHPSYASKSISNNIQKEKKRIESIIAKEVLKSRQHYLRIRFPNTYEALEQAGIHEDYTMGYASEIGFRAGICSPYKWYNLSKEESSNLSIHPFQIMDVSLKNYLNLDPETAIQKCKEMLDVVKLYDGEFIFIWHNSSVQGEWKNWNEVYLEIMDYGFKLLEN